MLPIRVVDPDGDRVPAPFWSVPVPTLLTQLRVTSTGISMAEAAKRQASYGRNMLRSRTTAAWPGQLLRQFSNPLVVLLIVAMMLSFVLGETTDALIVLSVVLLSALLGFFQEYRAAITVEKLLSIVTTKVRALRAGTVAALSADDVVPGDVVLLSAGDAIPADGVVLESTDLFVDEATLSGESFPAEKNAGVSAPNAALGERKNALFQGTHVVSGMAKLLIVHTGEKTEFGSIYQHLKRTAPETEFERGIRSFGNMLIFVTLALVTSILAINIYLEKPVGSSFLFALALAVGLTPELLPAIISITLATGARKMAKQKVIVKRLAAIENLGSMNVLCSDKTGTLTEGTVSVHTGLNCGGFPDERVLLFGHLNAYFESGFVNPIDQALRQMTRFSQDRQAYTKVDEVPYDFIRKRLSVVVAHAGMHTMITKGALRNVLDVCQRAETAGQLISMREARAGLEALYERFSLEGYRVIGLAVRDVTGDPVINRDDELDMTFIGFLLFEDPVKPGVIETLVTLKKLGITLKLITGDNRHIVNAIGARIGMAQSAIVTGGDLTHMTDEALRVRAMTADLFAEVEPNQKERILNALRATGNVVGYIGDGINDAAALHAADVGISVEGAVDVAKEAADIVLLERNLDVLAQGVRIGRITFANTLKYIFTTTSANFGNMLSMAGASLFLPFLPLLPKQILLNNFLSDLPSMAIAGDTVDPEMISQPQRWDIGFIRRFMLVFGLISSVFDYATFGALLLILNASAAQFRTAWFIESLMTELFITIVVRTRKPFIKSAPGRLLLLSVVGVAVTTLFLPFTGLGAIFEFVPLPAPYFALMLGITLLYLAASEAAKRAFYRSAIRAD